MTRDEAIKVIHRNNLQARGIDCSDLLTARANVAALVDSLIVLGLLKVEEPKSPHVHAVLLALREPTGEMCGMGATCCDGPLTAKMVWQAMIDEALK